MRRNEISNSDSVIDSRDVISRIDELEAERDDARGEWDGESLTDKPDALTEWEEDFGDELRALLKLQEEAEGSPDWTHGETLIRDSHFTDYIEQLIDDCYELPKELTSGQWPWRHIQVDFEAAAEEAKYDYMSVDFDGVEYWIRA
jgi:hypothetical protein